MLTFRAILNNWTTTDQMETPKTDSEMSVRPRKNIFPKNEICLIFVGKLEQANYTCLYQNSLI